MKPDRVARYRCRRYVGRSTIGLVRSLVAVLLVGATRVAGASTYEIHSGDDLYGRLAMLSAGDEVIVHAGTYITPGFYQVTWAGTSTQPIVIRGAPGERPVMLGNPSQNVININGSY